MRQLLVIAAIFVAIGAFFARYADRVIDTPASGETAAMATAAAPSTAERIVVIPRDSRGHFQVNGRVDGKSMGGFWSTPALR